MKIGMILNGSCFRISLECLNSYVQTYRTMFKSVIMICGCFFLALGSLIAQPGTLDGTFDSDGKVITSVDAWRDIGNGVALQSDGKLIVVGKKGDGTFYDFLIMRYNSDGSLDSTFGTNGKTITPISPEDDTAEDVIIQSDGKILVCGSAEDSVNFRFTLARYDSTGFLDLTFNGTGFVTTDIGIAQDNASGIMLQSDGKILVVGSSKNSSNSDFAVVRYNFDGTLDLTFGTGGIVVTPLGANDDFGICGVLQPDGKILVAGHAYSGTDRDCALVRYLANGSLDTSFDFDGKLIAPIGVGNDIIASLVLQTDGKILASGSSGQIAAVTDGDFTVLRFNSDGTFDNSFDSDGQMVVSLTTGDDFILAAQLQVDGRLVAVGYSSLGEMGMARFNSNGSLDNTFGASGIVLTDYSVGTDVAKGVVIQNDNKIVIAGYCNTPGNNSDVILGRYLSNSSLSLDEILTTSLTVYPNPLKNYGVLKYTLLSQTNLTIDLFDANGKMVCCFLDNENQKSGEHTQYIYLPENLRSGVYYVVVSSQLNTSAIKMIVE